MPPTTVCLNHGSSAVQPHALLVVISFRVSSMVTVRMWSDLGLKLR